MPGPTDQPTDHPTDPTDHPIDPATGRLTDRLQADLTTAIRSRDALTSATVRLALSAVRAEEVAGKQRRELSEAQVHQVLTREVKKRREAATAYDAAGRADRAAREREEAAVLEAYLPAQLSDADLDALVGRVLAAAGLSGLPAMGAAMKEVRPEVAGRADGGRVSAAVRRHLAA